MKATAARPGGAIDARADGTSVTLPHDLTPRILIDAYRWMLLSRRIDDKEIQLKNQSLIYFQISGAGHEAILVASAMHTRGGYDWFCPYYRDRALCLVLGVTPLDMFLQAVGAKDDPASRGRQMPSHWGSPALHIVSQGSPTGTQALQAAGLAEASLLYQRISDIPDRAEHFHPDDVVYCSIGDGATSEGEFWESLNTASQERLPIVYVVEDNGYAISVPVEAQTPGGNIARLVEAFPHLKVLEVDGTDFVASYGAVGEAVAWARARSGPALVHARVTRPYSHSLSDDERLYKTPEERAEEAKRDPIPRLRRLLLESGFVSEDDLADMASSVEREIQEAVDRALGATRPGKETAALWVFSPDIDPAGSQFESTPDTSGKPDTMVAAINRTLHDEMRANPRMVVFGQDVADCSREESLPRVPGKGGVFKVTHGLQKAFGSTRVYNSPLAEANIVGRAFGLGVRKLKPVVEIQFFDYIWPAMMQIRDEITMLRYRSGNGFSCPMVIRVPIGGYLRGGAPYHSQSGESIFAHCPGIRIAYPSNAQDAAGLLRTAIRCDDPVLFLEHKHLYRQTYNKSPYPGPDYTVPFGRAALRRAGEDVLVITWGALVQRTLLAAQQAEREGLSVAVLDLRTIIPYDWNGISEHVQKCNRVIVAHEDQLTCGFGAEISARIADELFHWLDAPIRRVAALDTPVAYAPDLEEEILPQSSDVLAAIREIGRY
jgi:2-oxoisovalerate dehydrogenase E1 component